MYILMVVTGLIIGSILNFIIEKISYNITKINKKEFNIFTPIICGLCCTILFLKLGFTIMLFKSIVMSSILIVISFIDIRYGIIPDFMVLLTLVTGIILSFLVKASLIDSILGILCGGGIMFIVGLIPNMIGAGDIKLMFALGVFLGANKTLWSLFLAFAIVTITSIVLGVFKIERKRDYISFGPFLSLASFISILIFNV